MLTFPLLLVLCLFFSTIMTGLLKRYGQSRLLDQPNHRSSHHIPTPRGGGMAIVATFLLVSPVLVVSQVSDLYGVSYGSLLLIWIAALGIALVGFIDDHLSLEPKTRLIVQSLSAALVVVAVDGLPELTFFGWQLNLAWFGLSGLAAQSLQLHGWHRWPRCR